MSRYFKALQLQRSMSKMSLDVAGLGVDGENENLNDFNTYEY
jgi:hypothetical protein